MEEDISLEDVLSSAFNYQMRNIFTAIPCVVLAVHDNLNDAKVDVQPLVNAKYKNGSAEELPPILSVPVVFPCSLTSSFTFPVNVGDSVLCVFAHRGIDNFKQGSGIPNAPVDYRKFDMRDAIAIPGLMPFGKSINNPQRRSWPHSTKDAVVSHNLATGKEVEIRFKDNGDLLINTNQNVEINCNKATVNAAAGEVNIPNSSWNGDIALNGNLTQQGIFVLDGITMNTHRHTGVDTGPGTSGTPV